MPGLGLPLGRAQIAMTSYRYLLSAILLADKSIHDVRSPPSPPGAEVAPSSHSISIILCGEYSSTDVLYWWAQVFAVDQNWGASIAVSALKISMAQLLNTFIRDCAFDVYIH